MMRPTTVNRFMASIHIQLLEVFPTLEPADRSAAFQGREFRYSDINSRPWKAALPPSARFMASHRGGRFRGGNFEPIP